MASAERDVVVIGGSAGAVQALYTLFADFAPTFNAAVAVVLHRHPSFISNLADLFNKRSTLEVIEPEQGESFRPGRIYLAPQDRHMMVYDRTIQLTRQPRQHHTRPAIDPLFLSAAASYGERVIGVLLTGNLSDGVTGLIRIKERGGLSLVQDPREAPFPSMPQNALIYDHVDLIFPVENLADLLSALVAGETVARATAGEDTRAVHGAASVRP